MIVKRRSLNLIKLGQKTIILSLNVLLLATTNVELTYVHARIYLLICQKNHIYSIAAKRKEN